MKVNIKQVLYDVDGKLIEPGGNPPMTLRDVITNSILANMQDDSEETKLKRYDIFKKIRNPKVTDVDFSADDVVIIKRAIGKLQPPLVVGQAFEMLEGKFEKPDWAEE